MATKKRSRVEPQNADPENAEHGPKSATIRRTEPSQPEEEGRTEQDPEFWFKDGNILLVAGGVEFKVYRGVLVDRSPVFRDMFSLPQPPSSESSPSPTEEIPVVHLSDSPEDLRHILRACMPTGWRSSLMSHERPTFYAVSAYIRLGDKYQMTQLLESAVNYLKTYYASDPKVYKSAHKRKNAAGFRGTSAIHVITLANLVQDTALLPVALMECCIYGEDIMDGFKHEDGAVEHLSRDYLKHCYRARLTLMKANMEAYMDIFNYPPPLGCMKYDKCNLELMACLRNVDHCIDLATCTNYDPLLSSRKVWLCSSCHTMLRRRAEVAQLKIWKRLPKILGITVDGWHGTSSNSLERSEGDTGSDSDSGSESDPNSDSHSQSSSSSDSD